MSARGRGCGGPTGGAGGRGRGRGGGGGQQPPVSSPNTGGRGNAGQSDPRVAAQQSSTVRDFGEGALGDGIEFWKGFYQSLRPTQMGLSLNVDMAARAFYEPRLVSDFVAEFLGRDISRPLSDQERIKVKKALRGVRVEVRRQDYMRRYKVQGLSVQPTSQLTFPIDDTGETISVVQYFLEKYNIRLRYPLLPAIQAGTDAKPTYLPMEICRLAGGQRYALKLNEKQVTNLLRAPLANAQRKGKIVL